MARIKMPNDLFGLIINSFPYAPLIVEKVKIINGYRSHPLVKHWILPDKEDIVEEIPKVLKDEDIQKYLGLKTVSSNIFKYQLREELSGIILKTLSYYCGRILKNAIRISRENTPKKYEIVFASK